MRILGEELGTIVPFFLRYPHSRGERRWTFPIELTGQGLLLQAISKSVEFSAEDFYALGTT